MESESSMVPHHQWVQVFVPEEELWSIGICSWVPCFHLFQNQHLQWTSVSSQQLYVTCVNTYSWEGEQLDKKQRWLLWKDHKKLLFRIDPALIAITLKAQLWHLAPYVTYKSIHKLYPNYTNMFYNTISLLVTHELNCIAGNLWDLKKLRCNPRMHISLESTDNSKTFYRTMFWSIVQVSWSKELTCNIVKNGKLKTRLNTMELPRRRRGETNPMGSGPIRWWEESPSRTL
jgi:hypothetical protein